MSSRPLLVVINPNSDPAATEAMTAIATETVVECVGAALRVEGRTATAGPRLITTEVELEHAAEGVVREGDAAAAGGAAGVVVSGFGDPGVASLARRLVIPVTGIAEAAVAEAAEGGRRFSIVTTTPLLINAIGGIVARYGRSAQLAAVRSTPGDAEVLMASSERLAEALLALCRRTVREDGAEVIVIGGGPLAPVARAIAGEVGVPLVEPVRAGSRLAVKRMAAAPD